MLHLDITQIRLHMAYFIGMVMMHIMFFVSQAKKAPKRAREKQTLKEE